MLVLHLPSRIWLEDAVQKLRGKEQGGQPRSFLGLGGVPAAGSRGASSERKLMFQGLRQPIFSMRELAWHPTGHLLAAVSFRH